MRLVFHLCLLDFQRLNEGLVFETLTRMVCASADSPWANRCLYLEIWVYCMLEMAFEMIWSSDCSLRDSDSVDSGVKD